MHLCGIIAWAGLAPRLRPSRPKTFQPDKHARSGSRPPAHVGGIDTGPPLGRAPGRGHAVGRPGRSVVVLRAGRTRGALPGNAELTKFRFAGVLPESGRAVHGCDGRRSASSPRARSTAHWPASGSVAGRRSTSYATCRNGRRAAGCGPSSAGRSLRRKNRCRRAPKTVLPRAAWTRRPRTWVPRRSQTVWSSNHPRKGANRAGVHALACLVRRAWPAEHAKA
jgi:hypothetical protein